MQSNEYSINYESVENLITDINTKAGELEEKINRIDGIAQTLQNYWKGSDAEQYITEIEKLKPEVQKLVVTYHTAMSVLKQQTEIMKDHQTMLASAAINDLTV